MAERGAGSARRRRERRLRSWLRHERMTVRMELAAARHHSAFKGAGPETHDAPRSQKMVNSRQEAVFFELYDEDTAGLRPTGLVEPPGPQERVPRHTVEQMADLAPRVLILDAPVPQLVDKLEDVLKVVDLPVPEQEIDVPKISSHSRPPLRRALPVPQTAEQLVDVPLPAWMRLALGTDAAGQVWTCVWKQSTGVNWSLEGTRHTQWTRPEGFTASPGRYINTGQG